MNEPTINNSQVALASRHQSFCEAVAGLNQLQHLYSRPTAMRSNAHLACLHNLETLRQQILDGVNAWARVGSTGVGHWVTRALQSALFREYTSLLTLIEQLTAEFGEILHFKSEKAFSPNDTMLTQLRKLKKQAASTIELEQRIAPELLEMGMIEWIDTQPAPPLTLH